MALDGTPSEHEIQPGVSRLKVFISYSRKDANFADDLDLHLDSHGFEPIVDRHGISPGEDWRPRLADLIHGADTIVFVLTNASARSDICHWEVQEASRLGKRLLVVVPGPISSEAIPPEQLSRLQWILCWPDPAIPGSGTAAGKRDLVRALKVDSQWLRERTRLMDQAAMWRARSDDLKGATSDATLIRGNVLEEATNWMARTPKGETVPQDVVQFIEASTALEARLKVELAANLNERERAIEKANRASGRVRFASIIGAGVSLAFLCVAGAFWWMASNAFAEADRYRAQIGEVRAEYEMNLEKSRASLAALSSDLAVAENRLGPYAEIDAHQADLLQLKASIAQLIPASTDATIRKNTGSGLAKAWQAYDGSTGWSESDRMQLIQRMSAQRDLLMKLRDSISSLGAMKPASTALPCDPRNPSCN